MDTRDGGDTPSAMEAAQDIVKVRDLVTHRKGIHVESDYRFADLKTDGEIEADWDLAPETAGFNVRGHLHGKLLLECARCLGDFPVPVAIDIDEHYVFNSYTDPYEREKELQSEDFYETIDEEGELDLKDLAYQFLVMESANQSTCGRPECTLAHV